ncbi:MAG: replication protein, partial [Armatimonadota bacterium]
MDLQVAQAPAADRVALREQPREPADARPSANPSLDAGFMQIPNELVDALVLYPGPGSAKDFVLAVARETLGWGRQRRRISTARLCRMTGWRPRRLRRVREYAAHANLIEWRAP